MSFQYDAINHDNSIKVGQDDAPIKVIEYINLRCPDSRDYEVNLVPYLDELIESGKVQRIIKHFDKEVRELEKGNLMNQFLNYETPEETAQMVHKLFQEQEDWAQNRLSQMPHLAGDYGLELQEKNRQIALDVMQEIKDANIERIPTVFVNDKAFVEHISLDEFKKEIDSLI